MNTWKNDSLNFSHYIILVLRIVCVHNAFAKQFFSQRFDNRNSCNYL